MFALLILFLALQRVVELQFSASNVAHLKAHGGFEVGRRHYGVMVLLHTSWFVAMLWEWWELASFPGWNLVALGWSLLLLGQSLRWLAISTLGRRWTTRVLILPGEPVVSSGPFRWLRHPNYLGVCMEIAGVPLIAGCWRTALVFSLLNLGLLRHRIRVEEKALREHCRPQEPTV